MNTSTLPSVLPSISVKALEIAEENSVGVSVGDAEDNTCISIRVFIVADSVTWCDITMIVL